MIGYNFELVQMCNFSQIECKIYNRCENNGQWIRSSATVKYGYNKDIIRYTIQSSIERERDIDREIGRERGRWIEATIEH